MEKQSNYILLDRKCLECGVSSTIKVESGVRKIKCPNCGAVNDFWLENEDPPSNHKDKENNWINEAEEKMLDNMTQLEKHIWYYGTRGNTENTIVEENPENLAKYQDMFKNPEVFKINYTVAVDPIVENGGKKEDSNTADDDEYDYLDIYKVVYENKNGLKIDPLPIQIKDEIPNWELKYRLDILEEENLELRRDLINLANVIKNLKSNEK